MWRAVAVSTTLALAVTVAACGNSTSDSGAPGTTAASGTATTSSGDGGSGGADGGAAQRKMFKTISGVPGVSDKKITYDVIATKANNPLGNCILDCYLAGIKAYFAYRNSQGGIYGRKLAVGQVLDDELAQNQVRALDVISGKKTFGVFEATLLASGWGDLDKAGIPTYAWGINFTEANNRPHIFGSIAVRCADCDARAVPYAVKLAGAKHVASIGYGVSENSKNCTNAVANSIKLYSSDIGADLAYVNDNLQYGLSNGIAPEVTAMKKAGVDFISTCIDLNGMKTLGQELERQGMSNVTLYHPNSYDQKFIASAGGLFDGDFVGVQFLPFEADTAGSALGDFMEWMKKQGSEPTELSMVGWINASEAFDGLLAAGPEFDQAKVTDALNAITDYTAGGLIAPIDWTTAHTPYTQATRHEDGNDKGQDCSATVRVKAGKFEVVGSREKPWLCWSLASEAWSEPVPTSFG